MAYETADKGEKFSPRDHPEWVGRLFLIYPTEVNVVSFVNDTTKQPEPTDVVTADVAILDLIDPETQRPKVLLGARIAGKALVPQIKGKVERKSAALGRLRQLPAQGAKSGAYVIDSEFTPADEQLAQQQDATQWRGSPYGPGVNAVNANVAPPTGAASPAAATPAPAAGPWFATDTALLTKLLTNGVANATTLDHATAQMIGASFA